MTFRAKKPEMDAAGKLEALKALRGQHDQKIRCAVVEVLYGTGGETGRFLEAEIAKLEAEVARQEEGPSMVVEGKGFHPVKPQLWQPGYNEDND